jgi:acetyl-CoA carboxylase beta subunit
MTSPSTTTTPNITTNTDSKRKKRKNRAQKNLQDQLQNTHPKWKSQAQQQIYSNKLRQALTRVNTRRGKAIREAADKALAMTAKGKTRWSRAILTTRLKLKFRKKKQKQRLTASPLNRSKKSRINVLRLKGKVVPSVQRKVKFLGGLVPGCKKEPLPVILEEAIDYIPALEMQVRAMSALFNLLSASTSGGGAGVGSGSG